MHAMIDYTYDKNKSRPRYFRKYRRNRVIKACVGNGNKGVLSVSGAAKILRAQTYLRLYSLGKLQCNI